MTFKNPKAAFNSPAYRQAGMRRNSKRHPKPGKFAVTFNSTYSSIVSLFESNQS
jgi:hypothetical protein